MAPPLIPLGYPGKVVDPSRFDENLKLGTDYNPPRPRVEFAYPEDDGDFAHAALRCVGVGKCRVPEAGTTMCPSYQVTREEKHSTRGRLRRRRLCGGDRGGRMAGRDAHRFA